MRNWIHVNELNEAMNCKASVKNEITSGMCGTMYVGSDRYAVVVTEVISPKKIKVAHMLDEHEQYIRQNDNGADILSPEFVEVYAQFVPDQWGYCGFHVPRIYTLRKNGRWMPAGKGMWETCSVHIGHAENYRDPSF